MRHCNDSEAHGGLSNLTHVLPPNKHKHTTETGKEWTDPAQGHHNLKPK